MVRRYLQRLLPSRSRGDRGEDGVAMIMAMLLSLILVAIPLAMMTANIGQLPLSRYEQDRATALAAADAGVQDYLNRLNHNPNYWEYSATNLPPDGNLAFTQFVPVSAQSNSSFKYSADSSQFGPQGIVYVTSTGKSRNATRTIKVGVRPIGFLDNLSMSNYNLVDPQLDPVAGSSTAYDCVYDHYQPNPESGGTGPDMNYCSGLINYWVGFSNFQNVANGPVRSNDDYYLCGNPDFKGQVTTGDPSTSHKPYWYDPAGCPGDAPNLEKGPIQSQGTISMPPSDSKIETYASSAGCVYTGPTAIQLSGTKMTVLSPDTLSANAGCYDTSTPGTPYTVDLTSSSFNGVVYVQGIPSSGTNSGPCQTNLSSWLSTSMDPCKSGDAFVQGSLNGQLTIATANNLFVTGDIKYNSFTGNTVLGLVANNFIEVNHPVDSYGGTVVGTVPFYSSGSTRWCFGAPADNTASTSFTTCDSTNTVSNNPAHHNVTIDAAILTVQQSMETANFSSGGVLGNLDVTGAIAGMYMDIEGVFNGSNSLIDGYNENYTYDTRLQHLTPPYFLDPSQTTWKQISYAECHGTC